MGGTHKFAPNFDVMKFVGGAGNTLIRLSSEAEDIR
jgi:hypothetical protein